MKLTLHTLQGEELFECNVDVSSSQDWSLMADNKLSITFQLEHCVNLSPGSYVDYDGVRFYLLKEFKPTEIDSATWSYNLTLFDAASWMSVTVPVNLLDGKNNPTFVYTASLREHAAIIVANLNRRMNTDQWKVGNIIDSSNITVKYDGRYCSAILQELVDDQDTEWWVDGMTLNIGRAEFGELIELGYGNGLLGNIVCDQADNMRSYAYLYPLGSTRNIDPTKYGYERLQLPNGQMYVDMSETGIAELVEERAFAGIFPRYEGAVTSVRSRAATSDNGEEFIIYYISDSDIPFNPNNYKMPGLVPNITFLSGELMGQDFEVNYDADAHEFEIITRWTSDNATQLPGGLLTPAVGDEYVVWNITMPDEYYPKAEQEFLEAAQKYADKAEKDISIYKASLDYIEVQERGLQLRPGQKVRLINPEYFPDKGYYDSRITRITRKLWYPDEVAIDVSAVRVIGSLSRIESSLSKAETRVSQLSVSIPAIIKSTDNSLPTDSSVYTSLRIDKEYLSRRKGGVMEAPLYIGNALASASWTGNKGMSFRPLQDGFYRGDIDEFHTKELFTETFSIAGIPFRKTANGQLFIDANVVFGGGVTIYGTDTTPAPSLFDGLPIDGRTIKRDGNGALYVDETALSISGGGGVADSVAWMNVTGKPTWITNTKPQYTYSEILNPPDLSIYALASSLANYALKSSIPTNNNQLTNGAGYITASALNGYATQTFVNTAVNGAKEWVEEQQYLTDITSGMIESVLGYQPYDGDTNRLGFLTSSALNGYATQSWVNTALAGYLPLSGGTVNGSITATSFIGNLTGNASNVAVGTGSSNAYRAIVVTNGNGGLYTAGTATGKPQYNYSTGDVKAKSFTTDGGSFIGNLTGNADSATNADTLDGKHATDLVETKTIGGSSDSLDLNSRKSRDTWLSTAWAFEGSDNVLNQPWERSAANVWTLPGSYPLQIARFYSSNTIKVRGSGGSSSWTDWQQIAYTDSNVASATKLATPRTIWGQSFDGTGNVLADKGVGLMSTQNYYGLSILPDTSVYGVRTFLTYDEGSTMGAYEISASYAVDGLSIGVATGLEYNTTIIPSAASYTPVVVIKKNGNVAVGGSTANEKLHVHGNVKATGTFTTTDYIRTSKYIETGYLHLTSGIDDSFRTSVFGDAAGWGRMKVLRTGGYETGNYGVLPGKYTTAMAFAMSDTHAFIAIPSAASKASEVVVGGGDADKLKWSAKLLHSLNFSDYALPITGGTIKGNLLTEGGIMMYSQRSLKNILSYEGLSLEQLSGIKPIKFTWKDGRDNRYHVGGVADDVMNVIPEVIYRSNDYLTMDYGNAGFYVAASLIKPVVDHEQRIKILERENKALREEIRQLKQAS